MVKKFTYSIIGILFFVLSGSLFSGALQLHGAIADSMQHFESFPESAWLIVLGSLLISGATVPAPPARCRPHPLDILRNSATGSRWSFRKNEALREEGFCYV